MIQRIQTLHLLAVVALMTAMFFPQLATVATLTPAVAEQTRSVTTAADGTITSITMNPISEKLTFNIWGIAQESQMVVGTTYLAVLVIIALLVAFINIFLYRHRWIQIRLCLALAVIVLGIEIFIGFYLYKLDSALSTITEHATSYSPMILAPIAALVFVYFAFRSISRDEALVRSLDRIR